jgi:hypothetical protein
MLSEAQEGEAVGRLGPANAIDIASSVSANTDLVSLESLATYTVGFSAYSVFAWLFDYPLFGGVMWYFGPLWGSLIMLGLTFAVDIGSIRLYDWSQRDWLALEFIRSHRAYAGRNPLRRVTRYLLTKTPVWIQVLCLSVKFNAFIITTLLREEVSSYNGLSRRDWGIFALSFVAAQLYWSLCIYGGIKGIALIFQ